MCFRKRPVEELKAVNHAWVGKKKRTGWSDHKVEGFPGVRYFAGTHRSESFPRGRPAMLMAADVPGRHGVPEREVINGEPRSISAWMAIAEAVKAPSRHRMRV